MRNKGTLHEDICNARYLNEFFLVKCFRQTLYRKSKHTIC